VATRLSPMILAKDKADEVHYREVAQNIFMSRGSESFDSRT
jgi:hypothetical protein